MWSENKVRIKDIAEELGVSTATVSNVLHGKTRKISERTVKAVEQKLEERGYIPNMAATLLARNNSRIMGVVINDHPKYEGHVFEDNFISAAINHLSDMIEACGYFMMLKKAKKITDIIEFASMWNLDGVIVIGFCEDEYQDLRERIRVPFVIYDGFARKMERFGNIIIDDFDGGRQAGAYLKKSGHNKVLCIADNDICMDLLRYHGLCEGLGHKADFLKIPMQADKREELYRSQLDRLKSYTAIFAVSDYYALEIMRFLQKNCITVPDDISVIGFDGSKDAFCSVPKLTTVLQDNLLRAQKAVNLLKDMIDGSTTSETIHIPVKLYIGDSVKAIDHAKTAENLLPE